MKAPNLSRHRTRAAAAAKEQQALQRRIDGLAARQSRKPPKKQGGPAPARMPKQHLVKPGLEADLKLAPRFQAPGYRGSGKLEGKVAIVTGGDSGIGRAVAVLFAREGADVAILYLDEHEDAEATCRAVEDEGRECLAIAGDVRDSRFCDDAVAAVVKRFGKLDILVNNAAFQLHAQSISDITDEHFDMTFRTNIYGYFQMARAALGHLPAGGCIVNTGSETGLFGAPSLLDYSCTKGAIHAFTRSLATQLVSKGIRVNCVAPGPVWTPLNPADSPAEKVQQFGTSTDMKRPAQPEEIAPAFVFLASEVCSSYVTGIVLPVMGGVLGSK